ncbi:MAG: DUF6364 family protein [Egibacteraceae bacterium]
MSTRNITLALPEELVRKAKVVAATRDTSISALVAEFFESLTHEADYDALWRRERELMAGGLPMRVGRVTWTRDELHDRD